LKVFLISLALLLALVFGGYAAFATQSGAPPGLPGDMPGPIIFPIVLAGRYHPWQPFLPAYDEATGSSYLIAENDPETPPVPNPSTWKWDEEMGGYVLQLPICLPNPPVRKFNMDGTWKEYRWDGEQWEESNNGRWKVQ
jgi:hypothetical protein